MIINKLVKLVRAVPEAVALSMCVFSFWYSGIMDPNIYAAIVVTALSCLAMRKLFQ